MPRRVLGALEDVILAIDLIVEFTRGRVRADLTSDMLLRSAVERQFTIVGEALIRAHRAEPALIQGLPDHRRIIGFRNVLVHDYGDVDLDIVWDAVVTDLPVLRAEVTSLLEALVAED